MAILAESEGGDPLIHMFHFSGVGDDNFPRMAPPSNSQFIYLNDFPMSVLRPRRGLWKMVLMVCRPYAFTRRTIKPCYVLECVWGLNKRSRANVPGARRNQFVANYGAVKKRWGFTQASTEDPIIEGSRKYLTMVEQSNSEAKNTFEAYDPQPEENSYSRMPLTDDLLDDSPQLIGRRVYKDKVTRVQGLMTTPVSSLPALTPRVRDDHVEWPQMGRLEQNVGNLGDPTDVNDVPEGTLVDLQRGQLLTHVITGIFEVQFEDDP